MARIDIKSIISFCDLDSGEVAEKLFPDIKFPREALTRIIKEGIPLNEDQIGALSKMTQLPIETLFTSAWKASVKRTDSGIIHVFTKGEYSAELNMGEGKTEICYKEVFLKETFVYNQTIKLSSYLSDLDNFINEIKDGKHS